MTYKFIEKQIEGAKDLAEKYPHMQVHQDIYKEHVEVLEKAKAFDEIRNVVKGYAHLKPHDSFDHKDSNEVLDIVMKIEEGD